MLGVYGQDPPDVVGKHVLMVDFSYKRPVLERMAGQAASIVILDHHKTAETDLAPFKIGLCGGVRFAWNDVAGVLEDYRDLRMPPVIAEFDMDRSGAQMAWDAFKGDAQFTVAVDGVTQPGTYTVTGGWSHKQQFDFHVPLTGGRHVVTVNFLNDLYGGTQSQDRNLYVESVGVNGAALHGWVGQYSRGPVDYAITVP